MTGTDIQVTVQLPEQLAIKMVGPWYLIKKRESDIIREAFNNALKENTHELASATSAGDLPTGTAQPSLWGTNLPAVG